MTRALFREFWWLMALIPFAIIVGVTTYRQSVRNSECAQRCFPMVWALSADQLCVCAGGGK